jgi:hypothetical protein
MGSQLHIHGDVNIKLRDPVVCQCRNLATTFTSNKCYCCCRLWRYSDKSYIDLRLRKQSSEGEHYICLPCMCNCEPLCDIIIKPGKEHLKTRATFLIMHSRLKVQFMYTIYLHCDKRLTRRDRIANLVKIY